MLGLTLALVALVAILLMLDKGDQKRKAESALPIQPEVVVQHEPLPPQPTPVTQPTPSVSSPPASTAVPPAVPTDDSAPSDTATANQEINAALPDRPVSVRVDVNPPDSKVALNGQEVKRPWTFTVEPGKKVALEIARKGYITRRIILDGTKSYVRVGMIPKKIKPEPSEGGTVPSSETSPAADTAAAVPAPPTSSSP